MNAVSKFCGDLHMIPERLKRFADEQFISKWPVDGCGIEKSAAQFHSTGKKTEQRFLFRRSTAMIGCAHRTESDGRNGHCCRS